MRSISASFDAYRIAFNDDYSQPFVPPKQHFRSETVDLQRGEVEWRGGNLYFDRWDYDFKATVLSPQQLAGNANDRSTTARITHHNTAGGGMKNNAICSTRDLTRAGNVDGGDAPLQAPTLRAAMAR